MNYVIGLDLGTTCVKAMLFDEKGNIVSSAGADDELFTPRQGWAEQNALRWVELSAGVIRAAVSGAGIDPGDVLAMSISSQGITVVPVDREFSPLGIAINWLDTRATDEIEIIRSSRNEEEIYKITGKTLNPAYTLPKILWLKRNEPDIYARAYKLLLPHNYLCAHLTGIPVTDHTMAGGTMLYDLNQQKWSDELLGLFDVDIGLLPEIRWGGAPVGPLTNKAAELFGLSEKTLLISGGQDQKIAAFGANLQMGSATISLGTCAAIEFMFDHAPYHPTRDLASFSYLEPGKWVLEACVSTAGAAIKWARDILFPDLGFDDMNEAAATCTTSGGVFFYPYLQGSGTPHNTSAQGAFTGLTLGTSKEELIRAIFEGVAMEVYANLCSARDAGVSVSGMCLFGGASKSALLCQILADVTGCAIQTFSTPEMGAFGAAKLAANAVGFKDFSLPASGVREPDVRQSARYSDQYQLYKENQPAIFNLK